jgi:hypothetical protein
VYVTLPSRINYVPCSHNPRIRTYPLYSVAACGLHVPSLVVQHRLIFCPLRTIEGVHAFFMPYHRAHSEFCCGRLLPDHLSRKRMRGVLRNMRRIRCRLAEALLGLCRNGLQNCRKTCPPRVLFQPLAKGELKDKHQCHICIGPFTLGLVA